VTRPGLRCNPASKISNRPAAGFSGHVIHGPHEIDISFGRVFVLRFQCGSA
jgi:hypothetical protein